jgi:hypothetical protein
LIIFGTLAAAGAAGVAAWRRSRSSAPEWDALDGGEPAFTGGPEPTPTSLTEPAAPTSLAETVTEEPLGGGAPEPPTTGDPLLDGLGTAEQTAGTSDVMADQPVVEVVEVVGATDAPEGAGIGSEEGAVTGETRSTDEPGEGGSSGRHREP